MNYPNKYQLDLLYLEHPQLLTKRKPSNRVRRPRGNTSYKLARMRSSYLNR